MFEFRSFVYGRVTWRLSGEGVPISSALRAPGDHAAGWPAATSLKRAHSPAISAWCSSRVRPAAARRAFSMSG
jgi:hypothetical protein